MGFLPPVEMTFWSSATLSAGRAGFEMTVEHKFYSAIKAVKFSDKMKKMHGNQLDAIYLY